MLAENAAALRWRGLVFPIEYRHPPVRWVIRGGGAPGGSRLYSTSRQRGRLLVHEAQLKAAHGDWNGAVQSHLDGVRLGVDIPHGAPLLGALVGTSCEAIARHEMEKHVEHLSAEQIRATVRRMEELAAKRASFDDVVKEEKRLMQAATPQRTGWDKVAGLIADMTVLRAIFNNTVNSSKWIFRRNETNHALLMVAFALRAFRAERGRYPQTLTELAPGYLKKAPADPFALDGPLRYKRVGENYLLYSIGPDGKDDGGKPIDDPKRASRRNASSRYQVIDNSLGDIVAGINK